MDKRTFTDPYLRGLKLPGVQINAKGERTEPGKPYKVAEYAPKGEGRLLVRVQPSGIKECFYRYREYLGIGKDGKRKEKDIMMSLGKYDSTGRNGKTLADIRKLYRKKRDVQQETGDVKEHEQAQKRQKAIEARKGTLRQLCAAYVESLSAAKKPSAKEAGAILERHALKPFPELADKRASDIQPQDIQRILAKMVKAGITRQVNICRSYLRAAFAYGLASEYDPRNLASNKATFGLPGNPAAAIKPIEEYERTGERVLSEDELRAYWNALEALPAIQRATLRLNLALAQQRPTQLLRASWASFDFDLLVKGDNDVTVYQGAAVLLKDPKGRGDSRDHLIPLTDFALSQLEPLKAINADSDTPFTSDGSRGLVLDTLSSAVADISKTLTAEKQIPAFQMRDLRRTAETMLQKLGVSREVRAHLLSHGRSAGVQAKHYERYDYLREKHAALEKWAAELERIFSGKDAKVVRGRFGKAA